MDTYEIRRHNLQALMDEEYGTGARGAKSKLAKRLDKQPDYISRCLYPPEKPGRKNIGEDFARQIEAVYGLDKYLMDVEGAFNTSPGTAFKVPPDTEQVKILKLSEGKKEKRYGFWAIDGLLENINREDRIQKIKFLKSIRSEISHNGASLREDKHHVQKLIYAISIAAAESPLEASEMMMLEAAVVCIGSRYEAEGLKESINEKLEELERAKARLEEANS